MNWSTGKNCEGLNYFKTPKRVLKCAESKKSHNSRPVKKTDSGASGVESKKPTRLTTARQLQVEANNKNKEAGSGSRRSGQPSPFSIAKKQALEHAKQKFDKTHALQRPETCSSSSQLKSFPGRGLRQAEV